MPVKPKPDGYHTITPYLFARDAAGAIDFYKAAFGATEVNRMTGQDGKTVMHAEIQIGDSRLMLSEENAAYGCFSPLHYNGTSVSIHLYVDNVDAAYERAVKAGATATMPPVDMFWGDRFGKLADPFGHHWSLATHVKDVTPEEMAKAMASGECG